MNVLILDDEKQSRNLVRQYLKDYAPTIETHEASNIAEAKLAIEHSKPEIIFLDVQLRGETGFDLLDQLQENPAKVIFITAYTDYAIKAFKYSAVDYLVKPLDRDEFVEAIAKVIHNTNKPSNQNIQFLQAQIRESSFLKDKLVIPTLEGFQLTSFSSIIYCKANGNYTDIVLDNHKKILSSYTLGHFDELLNSGFFLRIHRSFLINLNKISGYNRGEGGTVVMSNGDELDISRANKESFLRKFKA